MAEKASLPNPYENAPAAANGNQHGYGVPPASAPTFSDLAAGPSPYAAPANNAAPGYGVPEPVHQQSVHQTAPQAFIAQQPVAAQGMTAGVAITNSKNLEVDAKGERKWNHGLCDCFGDCATCCIACWCPCITYGEIEGRLDHLEKQGTVSPDTSSCNGPCWLHCCLTGFFGAGWVLQIIQRSKIRDRYRISGNLCGDCFTACCCNPCQLTQASREVEDEEHALLGPSAHGKA